MEVSNLISDATNVMTALAAFAGVIIAATGLYTWRHELHGRADFELARRVMLGVYEVRNEIRKIRDIFSAESAQAQYERLNAKASELDLALLEAEVLWGSKLQSQKRNLKDCLAKLRRAIRVDLRSEKSGPNLTDEQREEVDAILYGDGDDDDNFGNKLQGAVSGFEEALRPHLRRKR